MCATAEPITNRAEAETVHGKLVRLRLALLYSLQYRLSEAGRSPARRPDQAAAEHLDVAKQRANEERLDAITLTALADIDAAFDRIALGIYGRCTECNEEIPQERLEVLPETPVCTACDDRQGATASLA